MDTVLIQNGLVLTMVTAEPKITVGDILIEGSKISQIDKDIPADEGCKVIDATGKVVMPGLINCHNHAAMSLLRGYCDDLRLMEWLIEKIWPAEERMTGKDIYWGTMLSAAEMLKSGTATFADMYFFMDEVAQAVQDSGIRASLCRALVFHDQNAESRIEDTYRLFENWRGQADGRITTMVGPHAPYTCPPDKLKYSMELAKELDSPIHIHLAETKEEVNQIFEQCGRTPTQHLADLGLFDGFHVLLAHAVHLTKEDILLLNLKGGISHNPVSNQKLGCGVAPVIELIKHGVTVALGTDGPGSATTLDMFEEMKATAWMHKNKHFDPTAINTYQVLRMATVEGAKALGLEQEIGTLEAGKKADLIIVDIQKPHLTPSNDICALLAYAANGADVETTIVNGKVIMENRTLLTINEKEVMREAQKCSTRITS